MGATECVMAVTTQHAACNPTCLHPSQSWWPPLELLIYQEEERSQNNVNHSIRLFVHGGTHQHLLHYIHLLLQHMLWVAQSATCSHISSSRISCLLYIL